MVLIANREDVLWSDKTRIDYICERDIFVKGLILVDMEFCSISSQKDANTIIANFRYSTKDDLTTPPNKRIFPISYHFKKGDVIKVIAKNFGAKSEAPAVVLVETKDFE